MRPLSLANDAVEELPGDLTLEHAFLVLGEDRVVERLVVQGLVQEPAEEQVVAQLLAELPLAAHAEEGHEETALQQHFRGDGRPAGVGIHSVENPGESQKLLVLELLNFPDRVVDRDDLSRSNDRENGLLTGVHSSQAWSPSEAGPSYQSSTFQSACGILFVCLLKRTHHATTSLWTSDDGWSIRAS